VIKRGRTFELSVIRLGSSVFRYIVEGANVFITEDARRTLEKRGVILFKDASANKGGVTCSSMEVLACLALNEAEFDTHMRVSDSSNPPRFYREYVQQVKDKITDNASLEFNALWNEGLRTGLPRCELTDLLSGKIIKLKMDILESGNLWDDAELRGTVLTSAIPDALVPGLMSLDTIAQRVPVSYLQALFSSSLAARFYYTHGVDANPFHFFDFVRQVKHRTWRTDSSENGCKNT